MTLPLVILASYLIGAIPFGFLIARLRGVDIFAQGSGNIGATNVGRVLGRRFGILVFLLDFAKGAVPVLAAKTLLPAEDDAMWPHLLSVCAGLAAFLGHLFPIYLRFRGGKGVATGAGVVAVLLPLPGLVAFLVWVAVLCATRYVSVASVAGAVALCLIRLRMVPTPFEPENAVLTWFCVVAAALVIVRHRSNLSRLLKGKENRLQPSSTMLTFSKTIHVLALGCWFGSSIFFALATSLIFITYHDLAEKPLSERPPGLPLVEKKFDKEQGNRLAGVAVGPLFPPFFVLQGVCGFMTAATSLMFSATGRKIDKIRTYILIAALVTLLVAWPIAQHVSELRELRFAPDPNIAAEATTAFGTWHRVSLGFYFVTLLLVGTALALAAQLPSPPTSLPEGEGSKKTTASGPGPADEAAA